MPIYISARCFLDAARCDGRAAGDVDCGLSVEAWPVRGKIYIDVLSCLRPKPRWRRKNQWAQRAQWRLRSLKFGATPTETAVKLIISHGREGIVRPTTRRLHFDIAVADKSRHMAHIDFGGMEKNPDASGRPGGGWTRETEGKGFSRQDAKAPRRDRKGRSSLITSDANSIRVLLATLRLGGRTLQRGLGRLRGGAAGAGRRF